MPDLLVGILIILAVAGLVIAGKLVLVMIDFLAGMMHF